MGGRGRVGAAAPARHRVADRIRAGFDADLSHASEVELLFTPEATSTTHVALEHRHLERHGSEFELLQICRRTANVCSPAVNTAAFILASNDALADRAFVGAKADDIWKRPTPQT
jgi:hypothetical protein